ncbi:MAG TPA: hypothetical protein VMU37_03350, partial [Caulobacteraceae bacterium]|nr:hypothetical protein [Caulobacteraceae bacterium]
MQGAKIGLALGGTRLVSWGVAHIVPIADPADPRVAPYVQVRERDLVGRGDGFIAEGEVVLRVLLGGGSRCKATSLLVAEKRLERLAPLFRGLDEATPVYAASQAV